MILYGSEARNTLKKGIDTLADAVKSTLGPNGKNVVFERGNTVFVTKDGVTVAKNVKIENKAQEIGGRMVIEAAARTNFGVGDGTTTATLLTQELVRLGCEQIDSRKSNVDVHELRKGMESYTDRVIKHLESKAVDASDRLRQVATISANNDQATGELIASVLESVGREGVVTVEESPNIETEVKSVEGFEIPNGYVSPYFMTNDRAESVIEQPAILITDKKVTNIQQIAPLITKLAKIGRPLVLIAEEVEGPALGLLVTNKMQGNYLSLAIRAPYHSMMKREVLDDMAALFKTKVVSEEAGKKLEEVEPEHLGTCDKVISTKEKTIFVGGKGDVTQRIADIKLDLDLEHNEPDKEKLKERMGKLTGKISIIKVGAPSDTEMKEKKYLVEDAVCATKAALESGILPGGGSALLGAAALLEPEHTGDKRIGEEIIRKSLEAPLRQLADNSGVKSHDIIQEVLKGLKSEERYGYDAKSDKYVPDMVEAGIIDPLKVTVNALRNAVSVASTLITTDTLMYEPPKEDSKK